jgi:hypothetical protein
MPDIIPPPSVPTPEQESAYIGLYTLILTTIYLAGGSLPESKLERYLRRLNADRTTPLGPTDKLLARMVKDGYIVRVVDRSLPSEEAVEYVVGSRGRVEVGAEGAGGMVRAVYRGADGDLEKKLERSLNLEAAREVNAAKGGEKDKTGGMERQQQRKQSRRGTQGRRREDEDEDENEDEESSEEDDD